MNIELNDYDSKLYELWLNCYSAFNRIEYNNKKFIISGGDYSSDVECETMQELMDFIEDSVKEALLMFVLNKDELILKELVKE